MEYEREYMEKEQMASRRAETKESTGPDEVVFAANQKRAAGILRRGMMQSWLYDISERITALQDVLLTAEDESIEPDIKAALSGLYANDVPAAVSDGIGYIKSQEAEVDAIDAEIKRLQAIKRARENRLERIRKGYADFLGAVGKKKIETPRGCMSLSAPTYTTVIDDAASLPQMYTRQTIKVEPEKGRIKQAIQAGEDVPGAHLEARRGIRIK